MGELFPLLPGPPGLPFGEPFGESFGDTCPDAVGENVSLRGANREI